MTITSPLRIRAKVVLVGAPEVGKTSLVRRFVHSIFSETYHSTLGVKVDRKTVQVHGSDVTMLLWDMHGETDALSVANHYLRGASGALGVFDASRPDTVTKALELQDRVQKESPGVVHLMAANKSDLDPDWSTVNRLTSTLSGDELFRTSALSGAGVEQAFNLLATAIWTNATTKQHDR